MYIFDLDSVYHCATSQNNTTVGAFVGAMNNGDGYVCSDTANTAKDLDDNIKDFFRNIPREAVKQASEDDHICTAVVAKKLNGFSNLPANQRQRYVMMFAKAIRLSAIVVYHEPERTRFSVSQACEALDIPSMSLRAFESQYLLIDDLLN